MCLRASVSVHAQAPPFLVEVAEVQGDDGICPYTFMPWSFPGTPGPTYATRPPEVCQAFRYCLLST